MPGLTCYPVCFPAGGFFEYNSAQMRIAAHTSLNSTPRSSLSRLSRTFFLVVCALALLSIAVPRTAAAQAGAKHLLIYTIDVEGGQSTLLVSPSGASLLVDTGWPGNNGRDTDRIMAAMHDAGISKLDKVLITHFHVGPRGRRAESCCSAFKVGEFLDHGENREDSDITRHDYAAYLKAIQGKPRRIVHPGDTIDIPGLSITVLAADGEHIAAVPGIKPMPNPYAPASRSGKPTPARMRAPPGILVRYGKFRFLDMGDLTKAKEIPLVCPDNLIGTVDLYLVNHHGMNLSNSRAFVDAIHPRVAIMDNGAHKAGSPEAWQTVHESPGLAGPLHAAHRRGL